MKKQLISYLLLLLFFSLLWFGSSNFKSSSEALSLWFETLVPSMFCVLVMVKVLFACGAFHILAKPLALFAKVCNMSADSFAYVAAMMLLGFPAGAAFINEEVKKGYLSKQEGKRLLYCCSFATPGFIIMTLGNALFHNGSIGFLLYVVQLCSGMMLLCLTRKQPIHAQSASDAQTPAVTKMLGSAIVDSGITLYMMGGYLMLCMSIAAIIAPILPSLLQQPFQIIAEFSSGCFQIVDLALPPRLTMVLISMLLSFGGLCVHMQVICMSDQIAPAYSRYLRYRLLQAIISAVLTYLITGFCFH